MLTLSRRIRGRPAVYSIRLNRNSPLAANLVGWWPMGHRPSWGTLDVRDLSGYANPGTLTNMTAATDWLLDRRAALDFTGTAYVSLANSVSLLTKHTVTCWLDYRDAGDGIIIGGGSNTYAFYLDGPNNSTHKVYYNHGSGFASVVHGGFTSGEWNHIGVVRDGVSVQFYKNGSTLGSVQTLSMDNNMTLTQFGREAGGFHATMRLDDVRMWEQRPLSTEEIAQLYLETLDGSYGSLALAERGRIGVNAAAAAGGPFPWHMDDLSGGLSTLGMGI